MDVLKKNFYLVVLTNTAYLIWLFTVLETPLSYFFFILELGVMILSVLFIVNNYKRKYQLLGGPYSLRTIVDIFITTVNETPRIIEITLKAATEIAYANKRIYILDDGARDEIRAMAKKYDVNYLTRPDIHLHRDKAHNLNFGLTQSYGVFLLVLDADQVPKSSILDDLLGFFNDERVAMVTTRQDFNVEDENFNKENLFYSYMQVGSNTQNDSISCGSGVIYRRSALQSIGGFQTWNIVEDLYTSYMLTSNGFKSIYVPQAYTIGDAPTDLTVVYKQRGVWAQDTLRLLLWKNPLLNFRLTLRQRLDYFAICYAYIVSGIIFPLLFFINIYSIWFNDPILTSGREWYLVFKLPAFYTNLLMFIQLSGGASSIRAWASLFPVYLVAFFKALMYAKPAYKVTKKGAHPKRHIREVAPHMVLLIAGFLGIILYIVRWGVTWTLIADTFWFCVMLYWFGPFVLYGLAVRKKF